LGGDIFGGGGGIVRGMFDWPIVSEKCPGEFLGGLSVNFRKFKKCYDVPR